jgi:hypothetical protein
MIQSVPVLCNARVQCDPPLRVPDLRLLVPLRQDGGEVSTDDTTLVLDRLATPLLGQLLRHSLLVHSAEDNGPGDLPGVLALEEERLLLGRNESNTPMTVIMERRGRGEGGRANR